MTKTLQYGMNEQSVYLDIPDPVIQRIMRDDNSSLVRMSGVTRSRRVIEIDQHEDGWRLILEQGRVGNMHNAVVRGNAVRQMVASLVEVTTFTRPAEKDPLLDVTMELDRTHRRDPLGMKATLIWPDSSDRTLTLVASDAMRETAGLLGYVNKNEVNAQVSALVERSRGISLSAMNARRSGIETIGSGYDPESEATVLVAHNLSQREMQLVCLSGLVAIAKGVDS